MFNTIRAKLIALVLLALVVAGTLGAVALYDIRKLETAVNRASGYGLAAQNAGLTDMFHDNMRGLVEMYVGAVKDKLLSVLTKLLKTLPITLKKFA